MAEDKKTTLQVHALAKAVYKYYGDWRELIWRSFVGGIFTALGATVGFGLVLAILGFTLSKLGIIPVVGDFFLRANELLRLYTTPIS